MLLSGVTWPHQYFTNPEDEDMVMMGHRMFASWPEGWLGSVNYPNNVFPLFRKNPKNFFLPVKYPVEEPQCLKMGLWTDENQKSFEMHVYPFLQNERKVNFWRRLFANRDAGLLSMMSWDNTISAKVGSVDNHKLFLFLLIVLILIQNILTRILSVRRAPEVDLCLINAREELERTIMKKISPAVGPKLHILPMRKPLTVCC